MSELYTGVRVHEVKPEVINKLYKNRELAILDKRFAWPQNLYLVVKDKYGGQQSALARVKKDKIVLLGEVGEISGIRPRNKEQIMAFDSLMDDAIKVVSLTGQAGTGKTLMALAAALQKIEEGRYKRIIISKNSVSCGKDMGYLPGDLDEKFLPYNQGALCSIQFLLGNRKNIVQTAIEQYNIEFYPTAVIRGSSWHDSFLIVDEIQNLTPHELLTTGTRVAEGSKLIMLGDLSQIDIKEKRGRLRKENTGIFEFLNSPLSQEKEFAAHIHLIKNERSETAKLFSDIFEEPQ